MDKLKLSGKMKTINIEKHKVALEWEWGLPAYLDEMNIKYYHNKIEHVGDFFIFEVSNLNALFEIGKGFAEWKIKNNI